MPSHSGNDRRGRQNSRSVRRGYGEVIVPPTTPASSGAPRGYILKRVVTDSTRNAIVQNLAEPLGKKGVSLFRFISLGLFIQPESDNHMAATGMSKIDLRGKLVEAGNKIMQESEFDGQVVYNAEEIVALGRSATHRQLVFQLSKRHQRAATAERTKVLDHVGVAPEHRAPIQRVGIANAPIAIADSLATSLTTDLRKGLILPIGLAFQAPGDPIPFGTR